MRALHFAPVLALVGFPTLASAQELLTNGGFESPEAVCGFPVSFGDWGVDAAAIVGAEAGVAPYDGAFMLRLEFPFFNEVGPACVGVVGGASVDVAQLSDVSHCHPAGTSATLRYTARFNRSATGGTDQYTCILRAYDGAPADFSTTTPLDDVATSVGVGTSTSWVECQAELSLPAGATYVSTYVSARVVGGTREVYADGASLVPIAGRCGFDCTAPSATCPDPGSAATATFCDTTTGACVDCLGDGDCDDGNECTDDVCISGTCTSSTTAEGTPCSTGFCLEEACVQCVGDFECGLGGTCDPNTHTCSLIDIDAGVEDAGPEDMGAVDVGFVDAGLMDVGPRDLGASDAAGRDAAVRADASATVDAGVRPDAGAEEPEAEGCSCGTAQGGPSPAFAWALLALLGLAWRRRQWRGALRSAGTRSI